MRAIVLLVSEYLLPPHLAEKHVPASRCSAMRSPVRDEDFVLVVQIERRQLIPRFSSTAVAGLLTAAGFLPQLSRRFNQFSGLLFAAARSNCFFFSSPANCCHDCRNLAAETCACFFPSLRADLPCSKPSPRFGPDFPAPVTLEQSARSLFGIVS